MSIAQMRLPLAVALLVLGAARLTQAAEFVFYAASPTSSLSEAKGPVCFADPEKTWREQNQTDMNAMQERILEASGVKNVRLISVNDEREIFTAITMRCRAGVVLPGSPTIEGKSTAEFMAYVGSKLKKEYRPIDLGN